MSFFSQFKNTQPIEAKGFVPYEEIDAKGTSKLGYFFLILMVIFGVWQGNNFLGAIQDVVAYPEANSVCLATMEASLPSNNDTASYGSSYRSTYGDNGVKTSSECHFSARENAHSIPAVYDVVYPEYVTLAELQKNLQDVQNRLSDIQYNRDKAVDDYSVSLLEDIAKKNPVMNMGSIRGTIKTNDDLIASLTQVEKSLTETIDGVKTKIGEIVALHNADFNAVEKAHTRELDVYELKRFLLAVICILPVFFFVWRRYSASKAKRSEFSLIWGGLVAITAIMVAQIVLVFVYDILPHEFLQRVFAFLSNFKFLFVIVYWLGFILVPLFFGFLIYIIQKKYYNKKAVTMRAFKANKCPTCTMSIAPHMVFCSTCGTTLKSKCNSCGGVTPCAGEYCELCGIKKTMPV
jgi:hypothetical protein